MTGDEGVDDTALADAVAAIRRGEVIGLPTETVYGLAADAGNREAVASIYRIKGRPTDHPLIVHVASGIEAARWGRWNDAAQALSDACWPGPLTIVLPRRDDASPYACAGQSTVGLRVPSHPVAQALLRRLHAAGIAGLAAPSANRFGRVSPTQASHVRADLGDALAIVLDGGAATIGIESTIVDLSGDRPRVLRPGHLSADRIGSVLGVDPHTLDPTAGEPTAGDPAVAAAAVPRVPGSHRSHYAPRTPLVVVAPEALASALARARREHGRVAVWSARRPAGEQVLWIARPESVVDAERTLYASLRALDAFGAGLIVVERPAAIDAALRAADPAWAGIADRLRRAAAATQAVPAAPATGSARTPQRASR
ncbi:MAG: L-threonylcarbamoyladenylate synthase [Lautropia sp.]